MDIFEILLNNWGLAVTVAFLVIGATITGKRLAYFRWANETLFFAFDQAEKEGIAQDWSGYQKLQHYLAIWRAKYEEKYGEEPGINEVDRAQKKAADMAIKEKVHRLADPTLSA